MISSRDTPSRPPPEVIYQRLDTFFPKHDLDGPIIRAPSANTSGSPAYIALASPLPFTLLERISAQKSIRMVAQEYTKWIDQRSTLAQDGTSTTGMQSTKLWGCRLEEIVSPPDLSSGGLTPNGSIPTIKWIRGEFIGKGTYGRVYVVLNVTTGEIIVVKCFELPQPEAMSDGSPDNNSRQNMVLQALRMQGEALKDLKHPHIVEYLGVEETHLHANSIFLEYVPGGSIGRYLREHGTFADNVARSFTAQILSGLGYLHSKGFLHQDLRADSILVDMSGTCKISDFGLSGREFDNLPTSVTAIFTATSLWQPVFWMPPELVTATANAANTQSNKSKIDIWGLGCTVLEMWTGTRPWAGEEMVAVMFKLFRSQTPPVPEDVVLSEEAEDFRSKCFAINPIERLNASELREHPYLTLPPGWMFIGFT